MVVWEKNVFSSRQFPLPFVFVSWLVGVLGFEIRALNFRALLLEPCLQPLSCSFDYLKKEAVN
jgi:hypothetical protein